MFRKENTLTKIAQIEQVLTSTQAKVGLCFGTAALTLVPTFAFANDGEAGGGTMDGILSNIGNIVIAVIAIVGVIYTVKAVLEYMKGGEGSIGRIVTTVLVTCLFIGLVLVLVNAQNISSLVKPIADSGVTSASKLASEALKGSSAS